MSTNLTVSLENRPGTLADLAEALGQAGINIEGLCGFPAGGEALIQVLVEDAGAAREALEAAGIEVRDERDVTVFDCPDEPGALGSRARAMADAGVNIDLVYLATRTRIVVGTDDPDAAAAALG
jgi:hypothetical protein